MKPQLFPESKIKVGASLFKVFAWTDDNGVSHCDLDEHIITSIRSKPGTRSRFGSRKFGTNKDARKYVYMTQKNAYTFVNGKLQKSVSEYYKTNFRYGDDLPRGFYTTKFKALQYAPKDAEESVQWYIDELAKGNVEPSELEESKKELRLVKSKLTRLKNGNNT